MMFRKTLLGFFTTLLPPLLVTFGLAMVAGAGDRHHLGCGAVVGFDPARCFAAR